MSKFPFSGLGFWVLGILLCSLWACQTENDQPNEKSDQLLAQVFHKPLFYSELEGMVPTNSSPGDSALIVNSFIEKWVRESLLMHEAERHIPKDLNIDELVRDYRASLIRYNYEKLLVELQLDSLLTDDELMTYYEENKDQYQLEHAILRCSFVKIPLTAPDLNQLEDWWKADEEDHYTKIVDYCSKYASVYNLNDSIWYKMDDIAMQLPKGTLPTSKKELSLTDDDHTYLIRILETMPKKTIAPLAYVKNQISKVILHKRKIKLLEEKKEEIYDRETRRNNVKIYNE